MSDYEQERKLERLSVEDDIASHEMSIAQKRAIARKMKKQYGRDWKKLLNVRGDLKQEMSALGQTYRELNTPRPRRV